MKNFIKLLLLAFLYTSCGVDEYKFQDYVGEWDMTNTYNWIDADTLRAELIKSHACSIQREANIAIEPKIKSDDINYYWSIVDYGETFLLSHEYIDTWPTPGCIKTISRPFDIINRSEDEFELQLIIQKETNDLGQMSYIQYNFHFVRR